MLLPYNVDVPMTRVPWANWAVITITSIVSVAILSGWDPRDHGPSLQTAAAAQTSSTEPFPTEDQINFHKYYQERLVPPLALNPGKFSVVQLFSCTLVHADFLHLIGNMLFLFVFGNAVNAKLGHLPYLLVYLLAAAVAGVAWLALGDGRPAVGASGAIMGIVGAFLIFFPRNEVQVFFFNVFAARAGLALFDVAAWILIVIFLGFDLYGSLSGGGGVAYVAHLGGAVAGIALAVAWLAFGWATSEEYEENMLQLLGLQKR